MAEQTSESIDIKGTPDAIMDVIADLPSYPDWTDVKSAEVLEADADGRPKKVQLRIESGPIKDDIVFGYEFDGSKTCKWWLIESKTMKEHDGLYTLEDKGNGTVKVTYDLTVELNIPMIGLIRRKAEKKIVGTALKGLKERVEKG